jgi:hypothetical protein
MESVLDEGWHYGPDGTPEPGWVMGTAFQPYDTQDHLCAWGTVHGGDLAECRTCLDGRKGWLR